MKKTEMIFKTALCGAALLAGMTVALAWEPAGDRLKTKWAAEVMPENVWQSYPRPQLQRTEWQNLNGLWACSVTSQDAAMKDVAFDREILVPFCIESSLSGIAEAFTPKDKLWYKTQFTIDKSWSKKNIILHFGAVDYECEVFVDGKSVGHHKGGNNPFSFDITKYLKGSGTHTLVLAVTDPTDTASSPRGKQVLDPHGIWYTPVSGIWKTVWLEPVSSVYIDRIRVTPDIKAGKAAVKVALNGAKGTETVKISAYHDGVEVASAEGAASSEVPLSIADALLWTPDTPELYDLKISVYQKGSLVDEADSYFAFREVSKVKNSLGYEVFALNGKPIFQYGPLDQGWWPDGLLTPPCEEAMLYDMVQLKKMGFNTIRKHIKVEPELYYYYADSLGIMIWQDMVSGFASSRSEDEHVRRIDTEDWDAPEETVERWKTEYNEMVAILGFYPSITTWVVFNEGWGQHNTSEMAAYAASLDSSRIINSVSGWTDRGVGDVHDIHNYPSTSMVPADKTGGRISVLGEFGGLSLPMEGHVWVEGDGWGYRKVDRSLDLIAGYSKLVYDLETLVAQGLSGAIYTQTTDVEKELNGLLTYDRAEVKFPLNMMNIMHDRLYKIAPAKADILIPRLRNGEAVAVAPEASVVSEAIFTVKKNYEKLSLWLGTACRVRVLLNGKEVHSNKENRTGNYNQYNISNYVQFLKEGENVLTVEAFNPNKKNATDLDFSLTAF